MFNVQKPSGKWCERGRRSTRREACETARSAVREGACTGVRGGSGGGACGCAAEAHGCAGRRCMAGMPWRAVGRSRRRNQQPSHNNCGRWYSFSVRSSTLPSDLGVLRASSSVRQRYPLPAFLCAETMPVTGSRRIPGIPDPQKHSAATQPVQEAIAALPTECSQRTLTFPGW